MTDNIGWQLAYNEPQTAPTNDTPTNTKQVQPQAPNGNQHQSEEDMALDGDFQDQVPADEPQEDSLFSDMQDGDETEGDEGSELETEETSEYEIPELSLEDFQAKDVIANIDGQEITKQDWQQARAARNREGIYKNQIANHQKGIEFYHTNMQNMETHTNAVKQVFANFLQNFPAYNYSADDVLAWKEQGMTDEEIKQNFQAAEQFNQYAQMGLQALEEINNMKPEIRKEQVQTMAQNFNNTAMAAGSINDDHTDLVQPSYRKKVGQGLESMLGNKYGLTKEEIVKVMGTKSPKLMMVLHDFYRMSNAGKQQQKQKPSLRRQARQPNKTTGVNKMSFDQRVAYAEKKGWVGVNRRNFINFGEVPGR